MYAPSKRPFPPNSFALVRLITIKSDQRAPPTTTAAAEAIEAAIARLEPLSLPTKLLCNDTCSRERFHCYGQAYLTAHLLQLLQLRQTQTYPR